MDGLDSVLLPLITYLATSGAVVSALLQVAKRLSDLVDGLPDMLKLVALFLLGLAAAKVSAVLGVSVAQDWSFTQDSMVALVTAAVGVLYHRVKKAVVG
jgi:hypothetical protein